MFDMRGIGKKIAALRKAKDMTQVELADLLGISYQAVSNWERGDTMPDIAKLGDLSKIFEISIDDLLGNGKEAGIVEDILKEEKIDAKKHDKKIWESILPLLRPKMVDDIFENLDDLDDDWLLMLAPFLQQDKLDEWVQKAYQDNDKISLVALAPFVSKHVLSKLANQEASKDEDIKFEWVIALAPFLDREAVNELGYAVYQKRGPGKMVALAPFMSSETIEKIIENESKDGDFSKVMMLLPFSRQGFSNVFKNQFKAHFKQDMTAFKNQFKDMKKNMKQSFKHDDEEDTEAETDTASTEDKESDTKA
ncbi:MAG: XRE family transcriptional regulator [Acholeplasmataceae bacterium]|nr:MAG: XRE family transcriptional regulator [Acholeplasmataceae bacterium]